MNSSTQQSNLDQEFMEILESATVADRELLMQLILEQLTAG